MKTVERVFVLKGIKELVLVLLRTTKSKNGVILFVIKLNLINYKTTFFLILVINQLNAQNLFDMNMSYRLAFCKTIAQLMSHNIRRQLPRRK